jgi:tRNA-Thr(GGU) m(6)t(6)A37 methyltransferase TsaA
MKETRMVFRPIGFVSSKFRKPKDMVLACEKGLLYNAESRIIINRKISKGLEGLEKFSHLWVIYRLHEANRVELKTYPGPLSVKNLSKVGVYATRSQYRPNHIALRLVKIKKIEKNAIEVSGLDAIDGSPVIDIKPFVSHFDRPEKSKEADWYKWNL